MAGEIRIHAEDGGRMVGADFFGKLGGAASSETLKMPATVTVVRVRKLLNTGTVREDVTAEFFEAGEAAQIVTRETVTPGATDRADAAIGVVRRLREPAGLSSRTGDRYEIRFEATVNVPGDPTENVVGPLIVDQTGRASA